MPPKRKGPRNKPAKARTPILIDGFPKEQLSTEQMEEHILRLQEELDREEEERNYFQLKRDKSHKYCEITENELEEVRAEIKKIDKDIEEDERCYQIEIKVYKQKLKHALHEHQNKISELKANAVVSTQLVQEEQNQIETELHKEMRAVMVDMQEELDYENRLKELEPKHNNITEKQIAVKGEKRMELLQQELENQRKKVVRGVEDQWNNHINSLREDHNQAFNEIYALMVDMNPVMDVNKKLMAELGVTKTKMMAMEKDLVGVLQENKHLTELLQKVKEEIPEIERQMKYFTSKKIEVNEQVTRKKLDQQKSHNETLEQTLCKLQLERDELEKTAARNIQQVQDEAARKSAALERQLAGLRDGLEKTDARLLAVLSASDVDKTALDDIEKYLDASHYSIKDLEYKIAKLSQDRKDLLYFYEARQRALGVPVEEL